jgi:hypothetical protein
MAYTNIDDPSAYFQTALYTGNGSTQNITNDGNSDLKPDLVWTKARSGTSHHTNVDSSRGAGKQIYPNLTAAEETVSGVSGFLTDGFSLGSNGTANADGVTHVAWQWKANGGTTTAFTESGDNPGGTYQANTTAGFSIVTYTGTGAAGTVTHGLGVAPKFIIIKNRGVADPWAVYYGDATDYLVLNDTAATVDNAAWWNDTAPSSTVFTVNTDHSVNADGELYIAYAFAEVQGYSKFSTYVGNGNVDGPFVYTGFKPAFVLVKSSSATHNWHILDNKRDPSNVVDKYLNPDNTAAEDTFTFGDFVSNGFKWRSSSGTSFNESGTSYIYMAFAENPLQHQQAFLLQLGKLIKTR